MPGRGGLGGEQVGEPVQQARGRGATARPPWCPVGHHRGVRQGAECQFVAHALGEGRDVQRLPLQVHFDLKEQLGLPEAVMTDNTITFYEPVRPGDTITTGQRLRSVSPEKQTKLGTGRFWVIDVEYRNDRGELVGVESWTGFGYRRTA